MLQGSLSSVIKTSKILQVTAICDKKAAYAEFGQRSKATLEQDAMVDDSWGSRVTGLQQDTSLRAPTLHRVWVPVVINTARSY